VKVDSAVHFGGVDVAAAARQAEELGFAGVWTAEASHDPFVALAVAATATERLELATGIAVAFARNPMNLAVLANDLQLLSRGRFILGLGSQIKPHITKRYSMPWSHPAPRMRELVLAVRAIWESWATGDRLAFRGEYYTHTLMTPFFDPGPNPYGQPPILLAAVGEHMTAVAGEVGDGLLAHPFTTARYLREVSVPALERGAAATGRTRADLTVSLAGLIVTGATDEEVEQATVAVKGQLAFYGSTPAYRPVLDRHGWGDLQPELNALSKRGDWTTMGGLIDDEMLDTLAVVAPPGQVGARVAERFGDLIDRFGFYTPYPAGPDRLAEILAGFTS
jgi:probable F420-dependent oxidoreductase